jgi:putative aminopeptidase FrvX
LPNLLENLSRLADTFGPSGFEWEVQKLFKELVAGVAETTEDNLGNVVATHRGKNTTPRILLAAHLDEVGLLVRGILPGGCLKAVPLGGWWPPTLLGQRVVVRSQNGDHRGIIGAKPPHYLHEDERKRQIGFSELFIDVGARSQQETHELGIAVGDPVVPDVKTQCLSTKRTLVGKAFDDRAGCAVLLQVLQELARNHPNEIIGAGTVQEEVGMRGARTLASRLRPDLCLVLEGAPADDFPEAGPIIQGRLGAGPQIRYYDPSMLANRHLADLAILEARELAIPYQVAVREGGGTDGGVIQTQTPDGVPTVVIGTPVRYAHSHHGIVDLADLEATVILVKALIYRLDPATVGQIKHNPWGAHKKLD